MKREKTTATLLIAIFLVSMLSATLVMANPNGLSIEWLPPLTKHDEFGFKDGSTLPIKFRLEDDAGNFVMDESAKVTVKEILFSDNFESYALESDGSPTWTALGTGTWMIEDDGTGNQVYSGSNPTGPGGFAISTITLDTDPMIIEADFIEQGESPWENGLILFDYVSSTNFKAAGAAVGADEWRIQHFDGAWTIDNKLGETIDTDTPYHLRMVIENSKVTLYVNGEKKVDYTFGSIGDGNIGLFSVNAHAHFDDIYVTDLSQVPLASFSINDGLETPLKYELFSDDFESYDVGSNADPTWGDNEGGIWTVKTVDGNNVFEAKSDGTTRGTAIFAGDTSWTNYILEAKVWTNDGFMGLIYRADDAGKEYYDAYLNTGNNKEIWKHSDGLWARGNLLKQFFSVSPETWYRMKVVVFEDEITVFVAEDEQPYPETPTMYYSDQATPFTSGRIGLIFYDFSGTSELVARFDDVVVLGKQYQCNLQTREPEIPQGEYMITVSGEDYSFGYPFELVEQGKAKGKK